MAEVDPSSITPLTDQQEVLLSVAGIISGTLSVLGSCTIIYKVANNFHRSAPYDRLLLGLSLCDIVASITYAISPFLLNKETSQRVWAFGNEATATLLGFLFQFSFSAIFYNGMLSYYYLLTVKYGVKRKDFARKYERWMHLGTWGFFLSTATVGAIVGFYNEMEIGQGEWVINWPEGCEATDSCYSQYIGLVFGGVPTFFTFISLVVNNILIYLHVRKHLGGGPPAEFRQDDQVVANTKLNAGVDRVEFDMSEKDMKEDEQAPTKPRSLPQRAMLGDSASSSSSRSLGSVTQNTMVRQSPRHAAQIREVASQGFLYVLCFALAYTAGCTLRVLEGMDYTAKDEGRIYWLLALDAFMKPLQGFLNSFVYNRPNYIRFRANFPELGIFWAVRKACLDPNIPKLPKNGSVMDDRNDTTSRGGGNNRLPTAGARSPSCSRKRASYSSDLSVVREESEEDEDEEQRQNGGYPGLRFPKSYRFRPPSKFSWTDDKDNNNNSGSNQDVEPGTPQKDDPVQSTDSTSENTNNGEGYSESDELRMAEAIMMEDLTRLYKGTSSFQPSSHETDDISPNNTVKVLCMDGSVKDCSMMHWDNADVDDQSGLR